MSIYFELLLERKKSIPQMKLKNILSLIIFLNSYGLIAQDIKKYKVNSIDSPSLVKYYIVTLQSENNIELKVFSEKNINGGTNSIKEGRKYLLKVIPFYLNLPNDSDIMYVEGAAIFINSKLILNAGEKSFKTDNLKGLFYQSPRKLENNLWN
jgi:hypothetical protein